MDKYSSFQIPPILSSPTSNLARDYWRRKGSNRTQLQSQNNVSSKEASKFTAIPALQQLLPRALPCHRSRMYHLHRVSSLLYFFPLARVRVFIITFTFEMAVVPISCFAAGCPRLGVEGQATQRCC